MVKIATQCINVAKCAISVWRFSSHCVVKFTIVYSTNYKTVWKSIVWELLPYVVYYHTHSKNIDKCGKNPQSARRKPNYHNKCGKNCHKILSVQIEVGGWCRWFRPLELSETKKQIRSLFNMFVAPSETRIKHFR